MATHGCPTLPPKREFVAVEQEYDTGIMRAILTALLLLAGTSAWAEWVKVAEAGDIAFYVDPATVDNKGGIRQVSVIQDYAGQEPGGVRSRRVLYEIDCAGERLRSLSVTEHSEPMARGERVKFREGESEWMYVAPRTGSSIPAKDDVQDDSQVRLRPVGPPCGRAEESSVAHSRRLPTSEFEIPMNDLEIRAFLTDCTHGGARRRRQGRP